MTTPQGMLELADRIERANNFVGFERDTTKFVHLPVELSDDDKANIVTALRQAAAPNQGREALEACRAYLVEITRPHRVGAFIGTVSSYHPCHALIDKIDAALALTPAVAPDEAGEALCEICHKPFEIGDDYIFTRYPMHRRCALAQAQEPGEDRMDRLTEDQIKYMVDRFLGWKLPQNFNPDAGISFKATFNEHTAHPMRYDPSGTNLFDVTQADAMVRYMIEGLAPPQVGSGREEIARAKEALDNIARCHGYKLTGIELNEAVRAVVRALRPERSGGRE